jgi:hypothetical protein
MKQMPSRSKRTEMPSIEDPLQGHDTGATLASAFSELVRIHEKGTSAWLFPQGVHTLEVSIDLKSGRFDLKMDGAQRESSSFLSFSERDDSLRAAVEFARAMERIPAPQSLVVRDAPTEGSVVTNIPAKPVASPKLADVARYWGKCCIGADQFENNCAHFLSDAFIRCGFSELSAANDCVEAGARCTPSKRPVRARNMWCWFQKKATKTSTAPTKGTGWWAVFQLKESEYWGGHVALLDSDNWKFYGTGWYANWDQHLYQW